MVRFGLVGCGRISGYHLEALGFHDDAQVVAVCDVIPERAKFAASKIRAATEVAWFSDYDQMLKSGGFDVVSICTPSGLHPYQGVAAANAGFHVVTEKPMGIALEPVDAMIKACRENNVQLFTVLQNRLNPTVTLLKQAIDKGRFGKIHFVQVNVFWSRPQEYYDQASWRGTLELDGGAFMNQASHYVDLVQWLAGDVAEVQALTGTLARNIEAEDTGAAILRFQNGAIGTINVTMLVHPKNLEGSITILGERGTVKIGGVALNRIERWDFEGYEDEDKLVAESGYYPTSVYGHGHTGFYRNVIDALEGKATDFIDGTAGRKSLELILAIYQSAFTRKPVGVSDGA
ncbi:MAG TPA: Gfo/Idh/MocA family oxidoreductase [Myxococcota bacterium]|nr:Gfo/Idh/MocA family oxidoreductase [Myxococcota bacterium]HON24922.1 Gfo/Idh/MocA family oxidoreductase [Myxococcota bacterium]HOS61188.1 Gfo/Idh/MocA family oxidoreductase [Myxococcota bacterium]HPC90944.1 Gfo/Idh/MocA family oxidoreductase [Myxococcota bacterium]HPL24233.1 Gfo/Idh/MocA family oxidoreductase [Myxococcota bacterium]